MRLRIIKTGKPINKIILESEKITKQLKSEMNKIGIETKAKLESLINSKTGKLKKNITIEYMPNGWGVGNINLMDSNAKYWRVLNYGNKAPYKIVPKNAKALRFKDKNGKIIFRSQVMRGVIEPMNFVQKTRFWFTSKIKTLAQKLKGKK